MASFCTLIVLSGCNTAFMGIVLEEDVISIGFIILEYDWITFYGLENILFHSFYDVHYFILSLV